MPQQKFKSDNFANLGGENTKVSKYIMGEGEFLKVRNLDFSVPGSLSKRPGTTLITSATLTGRVTSLYEFERLSGFSQQIVAANTNLYRVNGTAYTPIVTGLADSALFDFVTFVDRMFFANGDTFSKYDGSSAPLFSLPPGNTSAFGVSPIVGGGLSGVYTVSYGYVNDRGYYGACSSGFTISLNGITFGSIQYNGMTTPTGYGITAIALYRTLAGSNDEFGTTNILVSSTTFTDAGLPTLNRLCPDSIFFTLAPRYLEIYNNQLFMSGFSSALSTVAFSDVGEPESVLPNYFFEVRTNDGDRVTGLKAYNGGLLTFKSNSFHELRGDNPSNFVIREVSDQYGCLSNRASVVWEDYCWFLDKKGIAEYNGANVAIVSDKIEPSFRNMNLAAAFDNACAIHDRFRNEVWFAFPASGSTTNNTVAVYDYVAKGWAIWEGLQVSSLALIKAALEKKTPYIGHYTGTVGYFGATFRNDLGVAFTCTAQTRFHGDLGESVTKMWRRLYGNVMETPGQTNFLSVNMYTDYGTTNVLSMSFPMVPFQTRLEFGVPAKAISFEFVHSSPTFALRLDGYTVEYRMQRMV